MDCDTTGIEPDFALVKFKKLAGGGYFKIVNQSVPAALAQARLLRSSRSARSSPTCPAPTRCSAHRTSVARQLKQRGLTDEDLAKVEQAIPGVFDLNLAFAPWVLGKETYERLGVDAEQHEPARLQSAQAPRLQRSADRRKPTTSSSVA